MGSGKAVICIDIVNLNETIDTQALKSSQKKFDNILIKIIVEINQLSM
jgi:hypothetical protein